MDETLPSVENYTLEYEGNGELYVESEITAPNKIKALILEVEGENVSYSDEFDITGTAVGKTTYDLHEHIDISDAPDGHYHAHLVIKDQAGKVIEFEGHFDK